MVYSCDEALFLVVIIGSKKASSLLIHGQVYRAIKLIYLSITQNVQRQKGNVR